MSEGRRQKACRQYPAQTAGVCGRAGGGAGPDSNKWRPQMTGWGRAAGGVETPTIKWPGVPQRERSQMKRAIVCLSAHAPVTRPVRGSENLSARRRRHAPKAASAAPAGILKL